jgi:hypothetical protein
MKKLIVILTVSLATLAAFAQGKVSFQNDSLHLVYSPFVDYSSLVADLYMGTSSSLLYLYASTTFGLASAPGKWTGMSVLANANATTGASAIPGGTSVFVEVAVHTTERPPMNIYDAGALQTYLASGSSDLFNFTLGSGITYPVLWGANGNWPIGTWPMDQYAPGARAAIILIPEPRTFALFGLASVALLVRRHGVKSALSNEL